MQILRVNEVTQWHERRFKFGKVLAGRFFLNLLIYSKEVKVFCGSFLLWDPWPQKHHLVWMRTLCCCVFPKSIEEDDHEVFHVVLTIMNEQRLAIFHTNWKTQRVAETAWGGWGLEHWRVWLKGLKRSLFATKRGSHRSQPSTFREGLSSFWW